MKSDKLHICIIGCGEIARNAHIPSLQRLKDKVNISFSSRDQNKAREYCDKYGGIQAYQGIDEVIADPDIDGVSICLPHNQHRDVAIACANAKKHILLEKPMACSLQEADEILQSVETNQVKLVIAECLAYSRSVQKIKELIDQGEIGEIRIIQSTLFVSGKPNDWRKNDKDMGGGALIDGGVHNINIFHQIGGRIREVFSVQPPKIIQDMEGEDSTITIMIFENGTIGQFNYSWGLQNIPECPYFQVYGTEGTIYDKAGIHLIHKDQGDNYISLPPGLVDGYEWIMEDFVDSILKNHVPRMTGKMGKEDIAVALAAYQSSSTRKVVQLK